VIGRPKIKNKKKNISLTINKKLIDILNDYLSDKGITKSEYAEFLIRKEVDKTTDKNQHIKNNHIKNADVKK